MLKSETDMTIYVWLRRSFGRKSNTVQVQYIQVNMSERRNETPCNGLKLLVVYDLCRSPGRKFREQQGKISSGCTLPLLRPLLRF